MLFDDEEEGSELDDDDWEGDSASGGLGRPDGSKDELETTFTPDSN